MSRDEVLRCHRHLLEVEVDGGHALPLAHLGAHLLPLLVVAHVQLRVLVQQLDRQAALAHAQPQLGAPLRAARVADDGGDDEHLLDALLDARDARRGGGGGGAPADHVLELEGTYLLRARHAHAARRLHDAAQLQPRVRDPHLQLLRVLVRGVRRPQLGGELRGEAVARLADALHHDARHAQRVDLAVGMVREDELARARHRVRVARHLGVDDQVVEGGDHALVPLDEHVGDRVLPRRRR